MAYNSNYARDYYAKNKDVLKRRHYSWKQKNRAKVNEMQRLWREKNKNSINAKDKERLATIEGFLARKLTHLKKTKRARSLEVEIDVDFLVGLWNNQKGRCAISGYPMRFPECSLFTVSVDRIDPSRAYLKDNVQLVCQGINFGKNKYSNQEMLDFWFFREHKEQSDEEVQA